MFDDRFLEVASVPTLANLYLDLRAQIEDYNNIQKVCLDRMILHTGSEEATQAAIAKAEAQNQF